MADLMETLRLACDDPMWANHVEMPKKLLRHAIDRLESLEALAAERKRVAHEFRRERDEALDRAVTAERALAERAGGVKVDALAQEIRRVDGSHSLGAGALAEALMPFLSTLITEPAAPERVPALTQVGWAYQDKKWDADRWHVCGREKPREHEGRRVEPIYIVEPAAPEGRQEAVRIGDAVLDWMVKFDLLDAGNEYYVSDVLAVLNDLTPSTRPAEQAVTEAMVEKVAQEIATAHKLHGRNFTAMAHAALKAAMEAGR